MVISGDLGRRPKLNGMTGIWRLQVSTDEDSHGDNGSANTIV